MYKYLIFLAVVAILGFGVYYYREESKHYCDMYNNALANNKFLEKRIEKEHAETLAVSKRNAELEQAAKLDKSFDWNADISHSIVIKRLQAN